VLLDLLWKTLREGQGNLSEAEVLRNELLKELLTVRDVEQQSGSGQHIYKKGELYCGAPKGQPDRKVQTRGDSQEARWRMTYRNQSYIKMTLGRPWFCAGLLFFPASALCRRLLTGAIARPPWDNLGRLGRFF